VLSGELELMATVVSSKKVPSGVVNGIRFSIDSDEQTLSDFGFVGDFYHYCYIGQHREEDALSSHGLLLQLIGDGTFIRRGLLSILGEEGRTSIWLSKEAQRTKIRIL
jgi:hypothetical protein